MSYVRWIEMTLYYVSQSLYRCRINTNMQHHTAYWRLCCLLFQTNTSSMQGTEPIKQRVYQVAAFLKDFHLNSNWMSPIPLERTAPWRRGWIYSINTCLNAKRCVLLSLVFRLAWTVPVQSPISLLHNARHILKNGDFVMLHWGDEACNTNQTFGVSWHAKFQLRYQMSDN